MAVSSFRKACWVVGVGLMVLGCYKQAEAQTPNPAGRGQAVPATYSFVLRGVPMEAALQQLVRTTKIDLAYDPALVAAKQVYCVAEEQPAEAVLRCVLQGSGLDFYRLSSGMYVVSLAAATAPRYGRLLGVVVDRQTGMPLPDAHLLLADGAIATTTNELGRFSLAQLKPGAYRLTASYVGYTSAMDSVVVPPGGTEVAVVSMEARPVVVEPVVIDGMPWRQPSDELGTATNADDDLRPAGSEDVVRSLDALMGVRVSDVTADVHVQGGEAGEHQFLLDGAPVYLPVNLGSLIGPFSPFAIGRLTVQKAGFGAEHGSQISGVIQAEHALDGASPRGLDVQLDPMSLNARLQLRRDKPGHTGAALMTSARYGLWDVYRPPAVQELLRDWDTADPFMMGAFARGTPMGEEDPAARYFREVPSMGAPRLGFHDFHAASRVRFGLLQSLHASAYWGRRGLDHDPHGLEAVPTSVYRDAYVWENAVGTLRYESVLSARMLLSTRLRGSYYRLQHDFGTEEVAAAALRSGEDGNRITEGAAEARMDYAASDRVHLQAGLEGIYTTSRFRVQGTQPQPIDHAFAAWRGAGFLTSRIHLGARLQLDAGVRLTHLDARRPLYAEPRLALRFDQDRSPFGPWSIRGAAGYYRQFVGQFDVSSLSPRALLSTTRVWMTVDSTVAPPEAYHLAAELLLRPDPTWTLRAEAYFKHQMHLLSVNYAAQPPAGTSGASFPQRAFLVDGEGYAHGVAVRAEKGLERGTLKLGYEYGYVERGTDNLELFGGNFYVVPWNEPHRLELALDWKPYRHVTMLGRWRGIWGRRWGFRQAYYDFIGAYRTLSETIPQPVQQNIREHIKAYNLKKPAEHRLSPFYQLDLSLAYTRRLGSLGIQGRIDLLNVFDQRNTADWRFVADRALYDQRQLLRRDSRLVQPFTPSLAVRLKW